MPFQESAESLKAKLHLGNASLPVLVGITVALVAGLGVTAAVLVGTLAGGEFVMESASGDDAALVDGRTEGSSSDGESQSDNADSPSSVDGSGGAQAVPSIFVHVSGAVASPGVYELAEGSRVNDAVQAAGGAAEGGAPDALNLARVLSDGEQVIVPTLEQAQAQAQAQTAPQGQSTGASDPAGGKVNINTASAEQLDTLPGVGESTAQKIIADREANGPFSSPEDLKRVSGIGDKKYAELADLITVG